MKFNIQPPTANHLSRAYYELCLLGARCVGERRPWPFRPKSVEEMLAVCGELSRYDSRLFEILLQTIDKRWQEINWLKLRQIISSSMSPQIFGVIGELLSGSTRNPEITNCFRFLMSGIKPAPTQYFYHHLYTPGSPMAQRAIGKRLKEFEKWGFLASERPVLNADSKITAGRLSRTARLECLKDLISRKKSIGIQDYIAALAQPISRQQALLDIRALPGIRRKGHGRGTSWVRP